VDGLRYPGLIGWKTPPGGDTNDYAVDIFHQAPKTGSYLLPGSRPAPALDDAIRATLELMEAPADAVRERGSYNLAGCSFTPAEIAAEIRRHIPHFEIDYAPDFRQQIAASWPRSIDDSVANAHWGWRAQFGLSEMVSDMLTNLRGA
jgi:nucleoside-diphosphate-sugar epimerase